MPIIRVTSFLLLIFSLYRFTERIDEFLKVTQRQTSSIAYIELAKAFIESVFADMDDSRTDQILNEIHHYSLRHGCRQELLPKYRLGIQTAHKIYKDNMEETLNFFCSYKWFMPSEQNKQLASRSMPTFETCFGFRPRDAC